ncbi:MAG: sodium-translocating pyrophosphatase [Thermoplasmata archaeon]|nr:sodium-translocating pyrophosphatase [Thermoplasmata archaeon]
MDLVEIAILLISLVALIYAGLQAYLILREEEGTEEMKKIANAIQEGSRAFMKRQYTTIAIVAIILVIIIAIALPNGPILALGFAVGAFGSAIAGYIGMHISIRANVRTANKAKQGLQKAFSLAFRGGSVTGMSVVGIALLAISVFYFWLRNPTLMVGFIFGASLISLFARVGGGIYTKGADVGADLVGKVKYGIPEDDPRNPAVIADNVGDNVGDCAGMGADLYETYVVTAISSMLLAYLLWQNHVLSSEKYVVLPLLFGSIAILATLISIPFVRIGKNNSIVGALHKGIIITSVLAAIGFFIVSYYYLNDIRAFYAGIIGIVIMALMVFITEYYTDYKYKPTLETSKASQSGAGVTIITGLAYALQASFIPMLFIVGGILISYFIFGGSFTSLLPTDIGIYGISIASTAMLSVAGIIISIDSYGPITDNAGGIAEMAGLPEGVRKVTDPLDAVGNTTKAITKGYAIGSAALAALSLFAAYQQVIYSHGYTLVEIINPLVLVGLLIGATLPFFFTSFLMRAVGRAANSIVQEVIRQFDTIKGLMEGKAKPEYGKCVDIVTRTALKELVIPGVIGVVTPIAVGFILGPLALGGLLLGVILSGFALAIMMTVGGGSWDNAKKYIELGNFGGKGSEAHKAAVVGDTVGDALKDTAGPAINPLVKVVNTVSILFIAVILTIHLL